jgi:hypothetical protein
MSNNSGRSGNKNPIYGHIEVNKDNKSRFILPEELESYIELGYIKGKPERIKKILSNVNSDMVMINDGYKNKMIHYYELYEYLSNGWNHGQLYSKSSYNKLKRSSSMRNKDRKWINNGEVNKFIKKTLSNDFIFIGITSKTSTITYAFDFID